MQFYRVVDRFLPRRLQVKLSLVVTALLLLLVSLIGALFSDSAKHLLQEQIGRKAIEMGTAIAVNEQVIHGLITENSSLVQKITESVRLATDAEFIVVGDTHGIRFSHPDPQRIGAKFVGGDEIRALRQGDSYYSQAIGTLGPSLRGIVPVRNLDHQIIGFVAVGYLTSSIEEKIRDKQLDIVQYVAIVVLFGIFGATLIAPRMSCTG